MLIRFLGLVLKLRNTRIIGLKLCSDSLICHCRREWFDLNQIVNMQKVSKAVRVKIDSPWLLDMVPVIVDGVLV